MVCWLESATIYVGFPYFLVVYPMFSLQSFSSAGYDTGCIGTYPSAASQYLRSSSNGPILTLAVLVGLVVDYLASSRLKFSIGPNLVNNQTTPNLCLGIRFFVDHVGTRLFPDVDQAVFTILPFS